MAIRIFDRELVGLREILGWAFDACVSRRELGEKNISVVDPDPEPHAWEPAPFALNGCNPDFLNVDLTATRKFGDWEAGLVAFGLYGGA
jgi:hypothetical protein